MSMVVGWGFMLWLHDGTVDVMISGISCVFRYIMCIYLIVDECWLPIYVAKMNIQIFLWYSLALTRDTLLICWGMCIWGFYYILATTLTRVYGRGWIRDFLWYLMNWDHRSLLWHDCNVMSDSILCLLVVRVISSIDIIVDQDDTDLDNLHSLGCQVSFAATRYISEQS